MALLLLAFVKLVGAFDRPKLDRPEPFVSPEASSAQNEIKDPAIETFKDCQNCPEMVIVPSGDFFMGASDEDLVPEMSAANMLVKSNLDSMKMQSRPRHIVSIGRRFAIGKFDITRGEYAKFVDATGHSGSKSCMIHYNNHYLHLGGAAWNNPGFLQSTDDPVVCVSRADLNAYIGWINSITDVTNDWKGLGPYRLPSEDEWEYSARAGTNTARWWGDDIGSGNANCRNCGMNSFEMTRASHISPVNRFGLGDVLGNAWQIVADCWHYGYIGAVSFNAVWTIDGCSRHVRRGGSWGSPAFQARSSARIQDDDDNPANDTGFRLVKELTQ